MKTYIDMVFRLKAAGMSVAKAVREVSQAYCLTSMESERLESLTAKG